MLTLDRQYHHVHGGELSEWLGREFPDRPLFLLYNTFPEDPVWEICEISGPGTCREHLIIGTSRSDFDRKMADELRGLMLSPVSVKEMLRDLRKSVGGKRSSDDDRQAKYRDWWSWYRRAMGSDHPMWKAMAGELGG